MATELSKEQRSELQRIGNRPVQVVDPETNAVYYYLVAGELFDRLRVLLGPAPLDVRDTYLAQESALAAVWDDPALDVYNSFADGKPNP